jgi:hypothetical protein
MRVAGRAGETGVSPACRFVVPDELSAHGIKLYGEGEHNISLQVKSNDEISVIAERFNH